MSSRSCFRRQDLAAFWQCPALALPTPAAAHPACMSPLARAPSCSASQVQGPQLQHRHGRDPRRVQVRSSDRPRRCSTTRLRCAPRRRRAGPSLQRSPAAMPTHSPLPTTNTPCPCPVPPSVQPLQLRIRLRGEAGGRRRRGLLRLQALHPGPQLQGAGVRHARQQDRVSGTLWGTVGGGAEAAQAGEHSCGSGWVPA